MLGAAAAVLGAGVLSPGGSRPFVLIAALGTGFGLQNSTVRHFGVADLTTTVLSLTLTRLAADSVLVGGPGAAPGAAGGIGRRHGDRVPPPAPVCCGSHPAR